MKQNPDENISKRQQLLAASALVPVLGALSRPTSLQALIYSLFVCAYLAPVIFKKKKKTDELPTSDEKENIPPTKAVATTNFFMVLIGSGLVSECLAWVSELFAVNPNPGLLHPQLFADLYLGLFYYLGLAVAWLILTRAFQFTLKEVFFLSFLCALITQAKLGTLNTLCERLVVDPVAGVLTVASLLVVSGSITSLAFLAGHKASKQEKKLQFTRLSTKYLLSLVLIVVLPELLAFAAGLAGKPLGLCPDKKPIWEAPLI
ncbi:MAG: hypothetical protein JSS83_17240 [Cyanobacteria bacterium SZAS LIN-3]|nr:hypothetical protein [Cyanobacteria bacterium SZAS LIN-3]